MRDTLTIRLPESLAEWLEETSVRTGQPKGVIIRTQLEKARSETKPSAAFMKLAGAKSGRANLSMRKGFSPS